MFKKIAVVVMALAALAALVALVVLYRALSGGGEHVFGALFQT